MSIFKNLFTKTPSITVAEVEARLNEKPAPFILDVRTTAEYREGHIAGSASIPLQKLGERLSKLPNNRDIICVCRSGNRSRQATKILINAGYNAVNMSGGMMQWSRQGFSTKTGKSR